MDKVQKILRKAEMPDGTKIQTEDWKEVYNEKTIWIGAYPKAKFGGRYGWIEKGKIFRLTINRGFSSDTEVNLIFDALVEGKLKLEDLSEHYYDIQRAKFYMGFEDVEYEPYM